MTDYDLGFCVLAGLVADGIYVLIAEQEVGQWVMMTRRETQGNTEP